MYVSHEAELEIFACLLESLSVLNCKENDLVFQVFAMMQFLRSLSFEEKKFICFNLDLVKKIGFREGGMGHSLNLKDFRSWKQN